VQREDRRWKILEKCPKRPQKGYETVKEKKIREWSSNRKNC